MNSKAKVNYARIVEEAVNHMEFFGGLMEAFKEQRQVDVWLKAGDQTDAIPAHKLILAARSKVFRNILESDDCKATSNNETITLSEMTQGELETFLEFMYNGSLPDTKLVQHVRTLYVAADKYEIPYLQDICRSQLIDSMDSSSAFDVLELAKIHSDKILEDAVSEFITTHMDEICFSSKFMSFAESNPDLTVQTIMDHLDKLKNDLALKGQRLLEASCPSIHSTAQVMGIDLIAGGKSTKTKNTAPKHDDVFYLKLLVKLYRFLVRKFNAEIVKRLEQTQQGAS